MKDSEKGIVTWVNGTFDVLHVGHLELFKYAASLSPVVMVGVDSDRRVKELKGPDRPLNNQEDRKKMLEAIKYVNVVVIFDTDEELENYLKMANAQIMVIGDEYKNKRVVGKEYVNEVRFFKKVPGYSSSKLINKTKES